MNAHSATHRQDWQRMAPLGTDKTDQWTRQIQDALAGDSGLREGLNDDEARPLVDWGAEQAATLAQRLAQASPPPDAEQVAMAAYTLGRLMTRVNWVVTYRTKKDTAWLTRAFIKINQLSQELFGPDAPTLSDDEIAAWIADQPQHDNGALVRGLLARLTPGSAAPAEAPPVETAPVAPERRPPPIPMPPRGDAPAPPDERANGALDQTADGAGSEPQNSLGEHATSRSLLGRFLGRQPDDQDTENDRQDRAAPEPPPSDASDDPPPTAGNEGT